MTSGCRLLAVGSILLLAILLLPRAAVGQIPAIDDAWTEYTNAPEAQADGWFTICGLSQRLVVESDCVCGATSVGCRATQARWQNRFGLQTSAPLEDVVALRFQHKATWTGLDYLPWNLFMTLQTTAAEIAAGYDLKQIIFRFDKAETWTLEELLLADGEWQWRSASSGLWNSIAPGGTTELTNLVSLEWYINTFMGIAIGDEMLIDELSLIEDPTSVDPRVTGLARLRTFPNPCTSKTTVSCRPQTEGFSRVTIVDLRGRLVRELVSGWLPAEWTEHAWDGRDAQGRSVAAGIYRVVMENGRERSTGSVTIVR